MQMRKVNKQLKRRVVKVISLEPLEVEVKVEKTLIKQIHATLPWFRNMNGSQGCCNQDMLQNDDHRLGE